MASTELQPGAGLRIPNPTPVDAYYMLPQVGEAPAQPYTSIAQACANVPVVVRYDGLTVNVNGVDHVWRNPDLSDAGLKPKTGGTGGGDTISTITLGANNILTVATDKGNKTVDLSRLDAKGDVIQSVALLNSILRIVTDQGTYQVDLSSLGTSTGTPTAGDTVTAFGLSTATNLRLTTDKGTFNVDLSAFAVKGDTISGFTLVNNTLTLTTDQGTRTVDLSIYATTAYVNQELAKKEPVIATKGTAFNKDFGTTAGTVAEGNHNHDTRYIRTVNGIGPDATGNVNVSGGSGTATNSLQKQSYAIMTGGAQSFALPTGAVGFTNVNYKEKNSGLAFPIFEGNLTLSNGNLLVAVTSDFELEAGDTVTVEWVVGGLGGGGGTGGDTIQTFVRVGDSLRITTDKATRDADLSDFRDYSKLFNKPAAPDLSNYATFTYVNTELGKKANTVHTHTADQITNFNSATDARIEAQKPLPGSLATIDPSTGKLYLALVPGQTREVFPFNSRSAFPTTGDPNALYIARDERRTYVWDGTGYTAIDASAVLSINGKTGNVVLTKGDVGLGNVDNTSDLNKPISTATQNALNQKVNGTDLKTVAFTGDFNDLSNKPLYTYIDPAIATFTTSAITLKREVFVEQDLNIKSQAPSNPFKYYRWTALASSMYLDGIDVDGFSTRLLEIENGGKMRLSGENPTYALSNQAGNGTVGVGADANDLPVWIDTQKGTTTRILLEGDTSGADQTTPFRINANTDGVKQTYDLPQGTQQVTGVAWDRNGTAQLLTLQDDYTVADGQITFVGFTVQAGDVFTGTAIGGNLTPVGVTTRQKLNKEWFAWNGTGVFSLQQSAWDIVMCAVDSAVQIEAGSAGNGTDYSVSSDRTSITIVPLAGYTPTSVYVTYYPETGPGGYVTPGTPPPYVYTPPTTPPVSTPDSITSLGASVNQSTVTVTATNANNKAMEYRVDGGAYQGSNIFANQSNGTHTYTVRVVGTTVTASVQQNVNTTATPPPVPAMQLQLEKLDETSDRANFRFTLTASVATTIDLFVNIQVTDDQPSRLVSVRLPAGQTQIQANGYSTRKANSYTNTQTIQGGNGYTVGTPSSGTFTVTGTGPVQTGKPVVSYQVGYAYSDDFRTFFSGSASVDRILTADLTVMVQVTNDEGTGIYPVVIQAGTSSTPLYGQTNRVAQDYYNTQTLQLSDLYERDAQYTSSFLVPALGTPAP